LLYWLSLADARKWPLTQDVEGSWLLNFRAKRGAEYLLLERVRRSTKRMALRELHKKVETTRSKFVKDYRTRIAGRYHTNSRKAPGVQIEGALLGRRLKATLMSSNTRLFLRAQVTKEKFQNVKCFDTISDRRCHARCSVQSCDRSHTAQESKRRCTGGLCPESGIAPSTDRHRERFDQGPSFHTRRTFAAKAHHAIG
jgi:hypothetical protein